MKGFKMLLTMLIAMTFAFGTIACEKKEDATTEAPTATAGEATPEVPPVVEPEPEAEPEAAPEGEEGAPAEGGTNNEPEAEAESQ